MRVERVVRVACPARGTLLASKRLDAYLSVLKWALELAGVPVLPALVDFLAEVARRRADPAELPGLAAMMPDSALVALAERRADEPIAGELRVIAGDMQGDSIGSWLKTLLSDAFYWTDNDLVVQTRSMYGGAPRLHARGGASFLLDRGGKVTHFNYFANERTVRGDRRRADAGAAGRLRADRPAVVGRRAKPAARAPRAPARAERRARPRQRPPGGVPAARASWAATWRVDGKRIWLSLRLVGGLTQLALSRAAATTCRADGPIGAVYDDLIEHLAATHEVIAVRLRLAPADRGRSRRLADAVDAALDARNASGAAGAPARPLDGRPGGAHDAARAAGDLAAPDGRATARAC